MSLLDRPPRSLPSAAQPVIRVGGFPRIDLLPAEVKQAGRLRATQSLLLALLVAIIAVIALVVFWAVLQVQAASDRLAAEQQLTNDLLLQQAEYAEVPKVASLLGQAETAQQVGTSTEVRWSQQLTELDQSLPSGASLSSVSVVGASPLTPYTGGPSTIGLPSVGQIDFTATTDSIPTAAEWVDGLERMRGYSGSALTSITKGDGEVFTVTGTVFFDTTAYWNRFASEVAVTEEEAGS